MNKLGGRKFLITIIVSFIGLTVEVLVPGGLSVTFAAFLSSILASFQITNTMITNKNLTLESQKGEPFHIPSVSLEKTTEVLPPSSVASVSPQFDTSALKEIIDESNAPIKEMLTVIAQTTGNTQKLLQSALTGKN